MSSKTDSTLKNFKKIGYYYREWKTNKEPQKIWSRCYEDIEENKNLAYGLYNEQEKKFTQKMKPK